MNSLSPFGYSIAAWKTERPDLPVFISGLSWEAGKFRLVVPLVPGDFVPVWRTEVEAEAVVAKFRLAPLDRYGFKVVDVGPSYCAGGPAAKNRMLRGVAGFVMPERPDYIFIAEQKFKDSGGVPPE